LMAMVAGGAVAVLIFAVPAFEYALKARTP
jgi:hypothetical protein